MPITINNSQQRLVEEKILVSNGFGKELGRGWSFSKELMEAGIKKRPRMIDPTLGFSAGFESHRAAKAVGRYMKKNKGKLAAAGIVGGGLGMAAGHAIGKRKKKVTHNEVPGFAPRRRGAIRRAVGGAMGAVGGAIKGTLGGGLKGAAAGGVGGTLAGGPIGTGVGAAMGGVGGGILGGVKGAFKGVKRGARKFSAPKVVYQ